MDSEIFLEVFASWHSAAYPSITSKCRSGGVPQLHISTDSKIRNFLRTSVSKNTIGSVVIAWKTHLHKSVEECRPCLSDFWQHWISAVFAQGPWVKGLVPRMVLLGASRTFKRWGPTGNLQATRGVFSKGSVGLQALPFSLLLPDIRQAALLQYTFLPRCASSHGPQPWGQKTMDWNLQNCEPK
jgi:hypothetical protein